MIGIDSGQYESETESWELIRQTYYRYYKYEDPDGFEHGLKYKAGPEGYAQMLKLGINPQTASDAQIEAYSTHYFEYDDETRRVTLEKVRGGSETLTHSYESNPDNPGVGDINVWATKTVETLPNGSRNTVYSNKAGNTILTKLEDNVTEEVWYRYLRFNTQGRPLVSARPSAIASVSEPSIGNTTLSVTLKSDAGMVLESAYYAVNQPGQGKILTWPENVTIKQGTGGASAKLLERTYLTQTVEGNSIHPVSTASVYPETGVPATTSYEYTFYDSEGSSSGFGAVTLGNYGQRCQ